MKYCCKNFREEHEKGVIEEPKFDKNSPYDDDEYWHVEWGWDTLMRLLYCPFCGAKLKSSKVKNFQAGDIKYGRKDV